MKEAAIPDPYRSQPFLLSSGDRLAGVRDTRPGESDKGALDAKTFDAIETDQLFDSLNQAVTHAGQSVLYRSLARPGTDAEIVQKKQDALRELESDPTLRDALQHFIDEMARSEHSLYELLYGTFTGGFAIDSSGTGKNDEMEFSGYGYHQFVDGTGFVVDLVEMEQALPQARSEYLRDLFKAIRDFGTSRIYSLIRGPVYAGRGKVQDGRRETPLFADSTFPAVHVQASADVSYPGSIGRSPLFFSGITGRFWNRLPGLWDTCAGDPHSAGRPDRYCLLGSRFCHLSVAEAVQA